MDTQAVIAQSRPLQRHPVVDGVYYRPRRINRTRDAAAEERRAVCRSSKASGPDGRMDGWMNGWIDGWTDGWMNGWMNGWRDA